MNVEYIEKDGTLLAVILSGGAPDSSSFYTSDDAVMQVGHVIRSAGTEIDRHAHHPIQRQIVGTPEVLVTIEGRAEIDVYDEERRLVATRELREGDVCVMLKGAHGFRVLEDTVFLEVKQGPYGGPGEKERF